MNNMKHVKLFEKFIDGSEYDQYEIVYRHPMYNSTNEPMGIVEFDYDNYPERPFRCLIWNDDDNDYKLYSGELAEDDAKDAIELEIERLYGYDKDEDGN